MQTSDTGTYSYRFFRFVDVSVRLRILVMLGHRETLETDALADELDVLLLRLTSLEKSLVNGLLVDLLSPVAWQAPPPPRRPSKTWKPPTVAEWETAVRDAEEGGPEALLDVLRRPPPHPSLQSVRQRLRAYAWEKIGSRTASDVFAARS